MKIFPIIAIMVPLLLTGCTSSRSIKPTHNSIPIPFNHLNKVFYKAKEKLQKNKGIDKQPLCFLADEKVRYPKDYKEEQEQIKQATENSLETYKNEMSRPKNDDIIKKITTEITK